MSMSVATRRRDTNPTPFSADTSLEGSSPAVGVRERASASTTAMEDLPQADTSRAGSSPPHDDDLLEERSPGKKSHSSSNNGKIVVSNVPSHLGLEELEQFLLPFGPFQNCEKLSQREGQPQTVQISYATQQQAQQALSELNGFEIEGNTLKAEPAMERGGRGGRGGGGARGGRGQAGAFSGIIGTGGRQTDFPLRILVQSDMVGAIIGRQGSTIRQITQQTRARVDVHRKDNVGSLEKAITIYGNPDNCTNACKRILEVMQQEANNTNKGEITLKVLAHNNLIGRIIGKGGNTIKRIMQETDTKITVSSIDLPDYCCSHQGQSINDINSFNLERIITVKGAIESMSKAESMISAKLRQSYENDLQAMAPQSMMFPGLHPMAMMATSGMGGGYSARGSGYPASIYGSAPPPYPPPVYQSGPPPVPAGPPQASDTVTTYLYIPNNAVGAIIGTKGSHIRQMIRFSGASVKIAPIDSDKIDQQPQERKVTIVGSPESQWKAQYLIFEKMREEGFVPGTDDVRLTVEIMVPSNQVGRIIGKGGQNVRELQRVTGSIIKLPEQAASPPPQDEETTVHIIGPFFSVQSAQRRIRAMVLQSVVGGAGGPGGAGGQGVPQGGPGGPGRQGPGGGAGGPRGRGGQQEPPQQ
ncbi:insulin-like growth factor 2 mRNA-binding protein 1 isoform X2 [Nilaparvata lugens]|uniref:insulin-like growth factor 2 mRNA-binding protein 1 isoform X2 n=1 Tax=Nilaparvata lugens TaxID=108931 RepID=UPI00193CDABD|nr:insulin-like growth factor 2 mRNA-binding protein 1 isoform X2 [Nilaparvata lugens]